MAIELIIKEKLLPNIKLDDARDRIQFTYRSLFRKQGHPRTLEYKSFKQYAVWTISNDGFIRYYENYEKIIPKMPEDRKKWLLIKKKRILGVLAGKNLIHKEKYNKIAREYYNTYGKKSPKYCRISNV